MYKYAIINNDFYNNNILDKNETDYQSIIKEYKELFIQKISQDISFFITLKIENENEIINLIKEELLAFLENKETIISFLDEANTNEKSKYKYIKSELNSILNGFVGVLEDNNQNNNENNNTNKNKLINEEMDYDKYYKEIISINGIPIEYNEIMENEINKIKIENQQKETNQIVINDENEKESDGTSNCEKDESNDNNESNHKETSDIQNSGDNFKISFLIEELKSIIEGSFVLVNLNIYYQYFLDTISQIFTNYALKLISKKVINQK